MEQKIADIVKDLFKTDVTAQVTRPEPEFGDYATNVALQLAGKSGKNAREVAEAIADALLSSGQFSDVTVAGPGFINVRLSADVLKNELSNMVHPGYGRSTLYAGKTVVTEYSDPNPFKVLHAGHLYTSIVGDAMSNLIEQAGGTVHRVNFGGDVGLHVAKTMWAIIRELGGEYPEKLSNIAEAGRSDWMAARYVEGTRAYEDDEQARVEITSLNKHVYQLHTNDEHSTAFAQIYWTCRDWSYNYFNAFYERIGTTFEKYYPESETAPVGLRTVLEQKDNGVYEESDGAIVFAGEPYGLHTRVFVNHQGLPTYEAKDVGLSIMKWDDYHFDESVIITANDITEYMKVVLKSIEQFQPELAHRTRHVTHGNVKLAGGVKMSSRMGNFVRAVDVLDIAAEENQKVQGEHNEYAVLGAVKYAFLKNRVGPDIIFEPRESVALQGNSGPYLQYAHARAASIRRKLPNDFLDEGVVSGEFDQEERRLLVKMVEYPEVIFEATKRLAPHLICTYLYELAQTFNRFYETSRIVGDEREAVRGSILIGYSEILKSGLNLLGIHAPEQM